MKTLKHYKSSQNYKTLYSLIKEQDVICIVQPYLDENSEREVIVRASYNEQGDLVEVGTLGMSYFMVKSLEEFEKMCQKYNLCYLEPNKCFSEDNTSSEDDTIKQKPLNKILCMIFLIILIVFLIQPYSLFALLLNRII